MLVVVGRKEKNFKMEELCEDTIDVFTESRDVITQASSARFGLWRIVLPFCG